MKKYFSILFMFALSLVILSRSIQAVENQDYKLIYFDGHIHTTHSDGSGSLADVKEVALARGLSAVIVTNHTKQIVDVNEWNEIVTQCAELSDPNFLMVPSFEVTGSEGYILRDHFLAWNVYDPFVGNDSNALSPEEYWLSPRNNTGTGPLYPEHIRSWMDYIHSHSGLGVHAHTWGTTQPDYDVDYIELYNFGTVKDIIENVKIATDGAISDEMAQQLGLVMNNFAVYGDRDLDMIIDVPGMGQEELRNALWIATGQWLGAPESIPLYSWDQQLMSYIVGDVNKPVFGAANSDAHNTANTLIDDPNNDDSDVGEAKNGLYVTNLDYLSFFEAIRSGRSFASTGPSLCMNVNDAMMGQTAWIDTDSNEPAQIHLEMNSNSDSAIIAKVDIIKNGQVLQTINPNVPVYDVNIVDEDVNSPGYYRTEIVSYDMISGEYQFAWTNPVFVNKIPKRTINYGWEDDGTILGSYLDIEPNNVSDPEPVYQGSNSLKLVDRTQSGTPQAYLAWINDLQDGDQITAGFWQYDVSPEASPSCRIWAHYTSDVNNIDSYAGSAGGNDSYGNGTGWEYLEHTWVFDSSNGTRSGMAIEVRTYSNQGDIVWIDNLKVTAPTRAEIIVPGS